MHNGDLRRYFVKVQGPKEEHEVLVFATSWDGAAEAAVEKLQDKTVRHRFRGWGSADGPWNVLGIMEA